MISNNLNGEPKINQSLPLISVVTIVFNGVSTLEKTILSVINQSYKNIEFIVIDGGSTDGTLDIIKKYHNFIDYWVSEPDKGIYDAMNKGVIHSKGAWINFMNAGDTFYSGKVIESIFKDNSCDSDFIYGNCLVEYPNKLVLRKAGKLKSIWRGMIFSHQSLFVKSEVIRNRPFREDLGTASDFESVYVGYLKKSSFKYIDQVISKVSSGGISDNYRIESIQMCQKIVAEHESGAITTLYYFFRVNLERIKLLLKKLR